jgi:hypothetical protein
MRTTLDIDADVLQAAKELARARNSTTGKEISALARKALAPTRVARVRNGVPLLRPRKPGSPRPTMALVNQLREDT